jgi:Rrf2 family protein
MGLINMSYSLGFWQALLAGVYVSDKVRGGAYEHVPTSRIAEDLDIPAPSLSRILRSMQRAGIVEAKEGSGGGVRLALPPDQVSLLAILDAVEGGPLFKTGPGVAVSGETPTRRQAALESALGSADTAMRNQLEEVTLADISDS